MMPVLSRPLTILGCVFAAAAWCPAAQDAGTVTLGPVVRPTVKVPSLSRNTFNYASIGAGPQPSDYVRPVELGVGHNRMLSETLPIYGMVQIDLVPLHGSFSERGGANNYLHGYDVKMMMVPVTIGAGWRWRLNQDLMLDLGPYANLGVLRSSLDYTVVTPDSTFDGSTSAWGLTMAAGLRTSVWWTKDEWRLGATLRAQFGRARATYTITESGSGASASERDETFSPDLNGIAGGMMLGLVF